MTATTPFCHWHIKTKENPAGTDCSVHLAEARCFPCPYSSPEDAQQESIRADATIRGRCEDFQPLGIK